MELDLRETLKDYLRKLPQTIRTDALLFVVLYAMQERPPEDLDGFEPLVSAYLSREGISGTAAVICTVAAMDHTFERQRDRHAFAEVALKQLIEEKPDFPQQSLLSLPLRRRHWEQAEDAWKTLRNGVISAASLRMFSDEMMKPRYSK